MGNRLARYLNSEIELVDAVEEREDGFVMPYLEGRHLSRNDPIAHLRELESLFNDIGMPVWSFGHWNPARRSNIIVTPEDEYKIVDYESSVPSIDTRGHFGYDVIHFEPLWRYIKSNEDAIKDAIGSREHDVLLEAFEECRDLSLSSEQKENPRKIRSVVESQKYLRRKSIEERLLRLYEQESITQEEMNSLQEYLQSKDFKRVLKHCSIHMGAHCGIWAVTHFVVPLPVVGAMIARPAYTAAMRAAYNLVCKDLKRIHSPDVMIGGLFPFVGNFSYSIPVAKELSYVGISVVDDLVGRENSQKLDEMPFYKRIPLAFYCQRIGYPIESLGVDETPKDT